LIISNFDIATNLKVEMYLPLDIFQPFILGVSLMGGHDVLDGDLNPSANWDWVAIESTVANCSISIGGSVDSNVFFQPDAGQLSLKLQSFDYDPSVNSAIRAGAKIRVRLVNGAYTKTLFSGFIDSINVDYYVQGSQPNQVNIKAYDSYKRLVNSRITTFDTTGLPAAYATPLEVFTEAVTEAGYTVSSSSVALAGALPKQLASETVASSFINDAVQVGLGLVWIDQETNQVVLGQRPSTTTAPPGMFTVGNNHGATNHLCMSDITVNADADAVYNSLKVSMSTNSATFVVKSDEPSITLYGETPKDLSINAYDAAELSRWADSVFTISPTKLVRSVETPAIDRTGNLTEAATFTPGTTIGVKYTRDPLAIDSIYAVTRVIHNIDVNNWFTTLELWKGQ
jgi:hypothetical protein